MNEDFESYSIEDDEDDESFRPEDSGGGKRLTMWTIVPRTMIMPTSGWELARESGPSPELATIRFFLPLCLISGASVFLSKFYPGQETFASLLVEAVISFCSFFLGYYMAIVFAKLFLPKEARGFPLTKYGRLLTMTGVSTLAIFHILFSALPMFDFVFEFLPLWTIFLLYKGIHPDDIGKERYPLSLGVMCVVVICSPILVEWIFSLFV